jgi:2',3'-cyclic-nucleotide 2'-phosphodiesterase
MGAKTFTTLLLGDIYGDPGCRAISFKLAALIKKYRADFVVVNGENACEGFGITCSQVDLLLGCGVDVITSGNHIWHDKDLVHTYLDSKEALLRPANYGSLLHGHGDVTLKKGTAGEVCVINLQGRVNMFPIDDPFKTATEILKRVKAKTIFVDFHAESAEEKEALAFYLDGKVTAVVGTHIHVQTMDEQILPKGTAYITDLGMCGPKDSVIGCDPEVALKRQKTQLPIKAKVYDNLAEIHGVCVVSSLETGKALEITRIVE